MWVLAVMEEGRRQPHVEGDGGIFCLSGCLPSVFLADVVPYPKIV
jgi:hypothetical protein